MRNDIPRHARAMMGASALFIATTAPVGAQLANASAAATALGGNYTALARNFNAAAWNPANLGLSGNSRFSLAILPATIRAGLGPVTMAEVAPFDNQLVPDAKKREWVNLINREGSQNLDGEVGVTWVALNMGRLGLQASTGAFTRGKLSPALMELFLFGNAGFRNGTPKDYTLSGSTVDGSVLTTIAASFAQPLSIKLGPLPAQRFSVGGTAKYVIGNALVTGVEAPGYVTSAPIAVRVNFPIIASDTGSLVNGSGVAFDVGAAWEAGPFRAGAAIRNLFSTFTWTPNASWMYVPLKVVFDSDSSEASTDSRPYGEAPASLRASVDDYRLKPVLALGGAFTGLGKLVLAGEVRQQVGEGLVVGPKSHVGVGAELRVIPFLPLRAGVAAVTGGTRFGGGFGLEFGAVNVQASGALAKLDGKDEGQVALTISLGGR